MILPFSQKFKDGTPTYFVRKIWISLMISDPRKTFSEMFEHYKDYAVKFWTFPEGENVDLAPKLHTIREDKHDRWHAGRMIHPVINNRSKNQFQFAPTFPCVSTQKIEIKYGKLEKDDETLKTIQVIVDGRFLETNEIKILAKNDGFESDAQFLAWFDHDFTGKIIHWTNLKY